MCVYIKRHTCTHRGIHVCVHVYVDMCVCMCTQIYVCNVQVHHPHLSTVHSPILTPHTSTAVCACTQASMHAYHMRHTYTHTHTHHAIYMYEVCTYIHPRYTQRERLWVHHVHTPLHATHTLHAQYHKHNSYAQATEPKKKSQIQVWTFDRGGRRVREPRERQRIRPLRTHLPGVCGVCVCNVHFGLTFQICIDNYCVCV